VRLVEHAEPLRARERVAHHDVGAGELGAEEVVALGQRMLQRVEHRARPRAVVGHRLRDVGGVLPERVPCNVAERRKGGSLGEVDPLEERRTERRPGCRHEAALPVALEDVLDDRPRLEHGDVAVLDGGYLSER
jgi:hypothetical protein